MTEGMAERLVHAIHYLYPIIFPALFQLIELLIRVIGFLNLSNNWLQKTVSSESAPGLLFI